MTEWMSQSVGTWLERPKGSRKGRGKVTMEIFFFLQVLPELLLFQRNASYNKQNQSQDKTLLILLH